MNYTYKKILMRGGFDKDTLTFKSVIDNNRKKK